MTRLAAICAHELSHLNEPPRVLLGRLVGALVFVPFVFLHPASKLWHGLGLLVMLALMVGLIAFNRRLARRMEHQADDVAAKNQGEAGTYARALARIYEINQMPAVMRGKPIHPHLYDRMLAAGVTPEFPRPQPPGRFSLNGVAILLLLAGLVAFLITSHQSPI